MINEEQNIFRKMIEPKTNFTSYLIPLVCKTGSSKESNRYFHFVYFYKASPLFPSLVSAIINLVNNVWAQSREPGLIFNELGSIRPTKSLF